MDARWDRWQASDGDSEAEGDGARASDDDDDQAFNPEENLVRLYIAAARLGYNLVDVPGDGNCALHAAVHGLRPFGVDADVPSLRAALVEAARCDEEFRDNALSLQEEAELDEWIVKMSHMEEYVDHMGLAALATALARPIVVFSPSSARVATHTPSHVPNMGDPVFLALKPQSFRRDLEGNEVPTSAGYYCAADPSAELPVPPTSRLGPASCFPIYSRSMTDESPTSLHLSPTQRASRSGTSSRRTASVSRAVSSSSSRDSSVASRPSSLVRVTSGLRR